MFVVDLKSELRERLYDKVGVCVFAEWSICNCKGLSEQTICLAVANLLSVPCGSQEL